MKHENKRTRSDSKIFPFQMIIMLIIWITNVDDGYSSSISKLQILLNKHFPKNFKNSITIITAAGLCKARKRFSSIIFKMFWLKDVLAVFYKNNKIKLWKGLQVCSCDATSITLPKEQDILEQFPLGKNDKKPRMLKAVIYDIFSKIPIFCEWGSPYKTHERALLFNMLPNLPKNLLLVLDRGYQSSCLFWIFLNKHIEFICRTNLNFKYKIIKKISENDMIISIKLSANQLYSAKKYIPIQILNNMLNQSLTVRLIKTSMNGFRPRYILCSFSDIEKYHYSDIADLYCKRWRIETYFKYLKHIFKIEQFHAKYLDGVYQEIYTALIVSVIIRFFMAQASDKYCVNYDELNFKIAASLFSLFLYIFDIDDSTYSTFIKIISANSSPVRNGRHFPRFFFHKILKRTVL